jgi:hypothetical protein
MCATEQTTHLSDPTFSFLIGGVVKLQKEEEPSGNFY